MFTCPACEQPINQASEICPYCGADLAPAPAAKRRNAQHKGLVITLVGALILVCCIWAIVWFVLPHPDVPPRAEAEAGAIAALHRVRAVLEDYQRRQGTFPNTIEQVSGAAGAAYANARGEGYSLIYRAGKPGSDGNIHQFVLLARPDFYGYRSFYLDQTGVIRATRQDRPATAHDPPIS
jgi:hypothetical protein